MTATLNKVVLVGSVYREPKQIGSAGHVELRLKTSNDSVGTQIHRIIVKSELIAKFVLKNVVQGNIVMVEGKLLTRIWKDRCDAQRESTEVVVAGVGGIVAVMGGA
jgi:single-strand DNA-binding protein